MPVKEVAQALIQFIGLMMFAETPAQPTGALVVIPRVPTPGLTASVASHVEAHTAFIVFPAKYYEEEKSTWKAAEFPRGHGAYRYVLLNGEHITLSGNANNTAIPHPLDTGLPSLSACCNLPATERTRRQEQRVIGLKPKLRPEYALPVAPRAAAVFRIPAGKLDACTAVAKNVHGRIDTLLKLDNDGSLVISAPVGDATTITRRAMKTLVLRGNATVWIINAPWEAVTAEEPPPLSHVPHSLAYYDMIDPATCQATPGCGRATPRFACNESISAPAGSNPPRTMPTPPIEPQYLIDFQCSNSQWP